MISAGCFLLIFLGLQVVSFPLSTQLSEGEEKVTKCILEVLVDSLSKASPGEVSSECLKTLKEDDRLLVMLHHQHLLKELEDLVHRENSKHRLGHERGHSMWESEKSEEEDLKKRDVETAAVHQRDTSKQTPSEVSGKEELAMKDAESQQEHKDLKEFEKSKTIEETIKEHKVSEGEKETRELQEEAKEFLEDEDEEEKKKRHSPEKQWREDFEDDKRNDKEKINKGFQMNEMLDKTSMERHHTSKRTGGMKRHFSEDEGSMEDGENYHHGEFLGSHHHHYHHGDHQNWEKEEENRSGVHPNNVKKRMDEKASDEEAAQFEAEEKGVKISSSKTHLHSVHGEHQLGSSLWKDKSYFHYHQGDGEDEELRKRHHEEEPHHKNKHHNHETEEEEEKEEEEEEEEEEEKEEREENKKEEEENEERELEDLKEIEFELEKALEKLGELHRG